MARRRASTSPDRQELEAAIELGITTVDPATGVPIVDLMLDPNVAGTDFERADDQVGDIGNPGVAVERPPVGRQLLVDMSVDGWEEKLEQAFRDISEELGFEFDPDKPTVVTERA